MEFIPVKSSAISEIGYDKELKTLSVRFLHGGQYDYPNVPEEEFKRFVGAPSIGRYYNKYIRQVYTA